VAAAAKMSLEIKAEPAHKERCDCCGGVTTRLTRFVYRDGDAYAAYFAVFSDNHPGGIVKALVGLGEWGDGASPEGRIAFGKWSPRQPQTGCAAAGRQRPGGRRKWNRHSFAT
jgi:hypothetical protein